MRQRSSAKDQARAILADAPNARWVVAETAWDENSEAQVRTHGNRLVASFVTEDDANLAVEAVAFVRRLAGEE